MQYLVKMMKSAQLAESSRMQSLLLPIKIESAQRQDDTDEIDESRVEAAADISPNLVCRPISIESVAEDKFSSLSNQISVEEFEGFLEANILGDSASHPGAHEWLKSITLARDCHECNIQLELIDEKNLQLRVLKFIPKGESLKLWFSQQLLATLKVPFLSPLNIQDEKLYTCKLCDYKCDMPNPLKIHLALNCGKEKGSTLWSRLRSLGGAPSPSTNSKGSYDAHNFCDFRPGLSLSPLKIPDKLRGTANSESPFYSTCDTKPESDIGPCLSLSQHHLPDELSSISSNSKSSSPFYVCAQEACDFRPSLSLSPLKSPEKLEEAVINCEKDVNGDSRTLGVSRRTLSKRHSAFKPYSNHSLSSRPWFTTPRPDDRPAMKLCASNFLISPSLSLATTCGVSPGADAFLTSGLAYHTPSKLAALNINKDPLEKSGVQLFQQQAAQIETFISNLGKSKQGHLCIYCGKTYSRKYGLKIHIRTHTGFKPLQCKYCLRPFGDPSNLNKHIRLHAGGKTPYKCDLCGKILVRRRDLEKHIKSRHYTC